MRLKTLSGLQREKIEEEYDITVGEEAYQEYVDSGKESSPISELWEELKL